MIFSDICIDPRYIYENVLYKEKELRLSAQHNHGLVLKGKESQIEIKARDFGFVAWGLHSNQISLGSELNIYPQYTDDVDGGGSQQIKIYRGNALNKKECMLTIRYTNCILDDWIYEADLLEDDRKDYQPTKNLGKRKFCVSLVQIPMTDPQVVLDWINKDYFAWEKHLTRITQPHSTLSEWVSSGLDMGVFCSVCLGKISIIKNDKLNEYHLHGINLEVLCHRLTCSKCGRRNPRIFPRCSVPTFDELDR